MPQRVNRILIVETGVVCTSYREAQRETGVYWKRVADVVNGRLPSYGGYTFARVVYVD